MPIRCKSDVKRLPSLRSTKNCVEAVAETRAADKPGVLIQGLEREGAATKDNSLFCKLRLDGFPSAARGAPGIGVTFNTDAKAVLNVSAQDKSAEAQQKRQPHSSQQQQTVQGEKEEEKRRKGEEQEEEKKEVGEKEVKENDPKKRKTGRLTKSVTKEREPEECEHLRSRARLPPQRASQRTGGSGRTCQLTPASKPSTLPSGREQAATVDDKAVSKRFVCFGRPCSPVSALEAFRPSSASDCLVIKNKEQGESREENENEGESKQLERKNDDAAQRRIDVCVTRATRGACKRSVRFSPAQRSEKGRSVKSHVRRMSTRVRRGSRRGCMTMLQ